MRATIIQYNAGAGTGVLAADGRQYDFSIRAWRSTSAPTVCQAVTIELDGETVVAVTVVPNDLLWRETAGALKERLGGAGALAGAHGGEIGRNILGSIGVPVALAYGVFLLASLVFDFGTFKTLGNAGSISLYNTVDTLSRLDRGSYLFLVILAYASFLVPVFWKHRLAPLAWLTPAVLLAVLGWNVHGLYSDAMRELAGMNNMFGMFSGRARQINVSFSDFFTFGLGFYVCTIAAFVTAASGVRKSVLS
jgi:hypothetical protein